MIIAKQLLLEPVREPKTSGTFDRPQFPVDFFLRNLKKPATLIRDIGIQGQKIAKQPILEQIKRPATLIEDINLLKLSHLDGDRGPLGTQ